MNNFRLLISATLLLLAASLSATAQVQIIETVAGIGGSAGFSGDLGQATAAKMNANYMIARDAAENLYISDAGNARVRMVNKSTGIITTIAGIGTTGFSGDGSPATAAQFGTNGFGSVGLVGIAVNASGSMVYVCDGTNNRIRAINMATGIINTICGNGTAGFVGDGAAASATTCEISGPRGIWVDGAGNIYFSDYGNKRIRAINAATGIIATIAGNGAAGYAGDGGLAATCSINNVIGLTVDGSGNVYIADQGNNRIRKITASTGIINTICGNGTAGFAGDGALASATSCEVKAPYDVKLDAVGNLYIADEGNLRVRVINGSGIINTVAGNGTGGFPAFAGDGGPATAAALRMSQVVSVAVSNTIGNFYISDKGFDVVREVRPNTNPYFANGTRQTITMCENAPADSLKALLAVIDSDQKQTLTWKAVAPAPLNGTLHAAATAATNGDTAKAGGMSYTPTTGYSGMDSFYVQVSDGYDSTIDTIIVNITPLPTVAAIMGSSSVCDGASIVLTDATAGGTWSTVVGNATVATGTVSGVVAGPDTVIYSLTNVCGTASDSLAITVNPLPVAGTITGADSVCSGSSIPVADGAPGGTWSATNGNAVVASGIVTGINPMTIDTIQYTVINGCGTAVASLAVSVNTVPGMGTSLSGTAIFCAGSTSLLTSTVGGGTWSASNGNATVAGGLVTGISGGQDTITYAVSNTCGVNNITQVVTINPLPNPGTITGLTSVCLAGTILESDLVAGGTWSASNANATITAGGLVTGMAVGTDIITYRVTNGCGSAFTTTTVNIVSIPSAGTITGSGTVCQSGTTTLTDVTTGGVWTASNANATVAAGVVTGVTAGTDVITYTVTFSCGTAFTTYPMTINPLPAPAAISGASSVCAGSSISLSDGSSGGVWSVVNPSATITAGGTLTGAAAGVETVSYSLTNGCGTVAATMPVTVNPVVIPAIAFSASPGFATCPGTLVTYSSIPTNGGVTPTYQWSVNTIPLGTGSTFSFTPSNGQVIVCKMTSTAACASPTTVSDTVIVVVHPNETPSVSMVTGAAGDTLCVGNTSTYTATPVNGGSTPTYQWFVNGSLYAAGNPFTYVPASGDVVYCALTSSYVCPTPATVMSNSVTMTVNTTETPSVSISVTPGNPVCAGYPVTYVVHSLYGGLTPFYRWTRNGINVATGPAYIDTPSSGDDVYAMLASSATCTVLDSVFSNHITMLTVSDAGFTVSVTATSGTTLGIGATTTFVAVATGSSAAPTFQWYLNGTAIPGATNSTYTLTGVAAGTELINCVAGSNDACARSAISNVLPVTVTGVGVPQVAAVEGTLKIAPNPSNGNFTLHVLSARNENLHIVITNTLGVVVRELDAATNTAINLGLNQAAGLYLVTAATASNLYQAKVVIE